MKKVWQTAANKFSSKGCKELQTIFIEAQKISSKFILGNFRQNCSNLQNFCCFADKLRCKTL